MESSTECLRRLLDERGVEWWPSDERWNADVITHWYAGLLEWTAIEGEDGLWVNAGVAGHNSLTPEQAIAATLGREPDDAAMTRLHDQLNATMLKYEMAQGIEKRDGDAAIVVPWVAKMHALLEEAATLGAGTCHNASKVMDEHGQARFACSECGAWIDSRMLWNPEYRNGESPWVNDCKLNYCPNCGKRVVDE